VERASTEGDWSRSVLEHECTDILKNNLIFSMTGARKGIRPMKLNKTAMYPDFILTSGNRPTLPQCGKDGVVLNGLRSRDIKR